MAVGSVADVLHGGGKQILHEESRHAVGQVRTNLQAGAVPDIPPLESQILLPKVERKDFAAGSLLHRSAGPSPENPFFYCTETGIVAHRKGILPGNLQAVVVLGIVRGGYLNRGLETLGGRGVVDIRGGGRAEVVHIGSGIGKSLQQCLVYHRRGQTHVPSDHHLTAVEKLLLTVMVLLAALMLTPSFAACAVEAFAMAK